MRKGDMSLVLWTHQCLLLIRSEFSLIWSKSVADPGFPRGRGAKPPRGVGANIRFFQISPKTAFPLRSATVSSQVERAEHKHHFILISSRHVRPSDDGRQDRGWWSASFVLRYSRSWFGPHWNGPDPLVSWDNQLDLWWEQWKPRFCWCSRRFENNGSAYD